MFTGLTVADRYACPRCSGRRMLGQMMERFRPDASEIGRSRSLGGDGTEEGDINCKLAVIVAQELERTIVERFGVCRDRSKEAFLRATHEDAPLWWWPTALPRVLCAAR